MKSSILSSSSFHPTYLLLILSLWITTSFAAPIVMAGKLLTADTWNATMKGTWLIEHFSPYCHHCQAFAPHWRQLVDDRKTDGEAHNFFFAQVDCAANGDLCALNNVKYYPSIFLYENGVFKDEYDGKRQVKELSDYIDDHLPKAIPDSPKLKDEIEKVVANVTKLVAEGVKTAPVLTASASNLHVAEDPSEEALPTPREVILEAAGVLPKPPTEEEKTRLPAQFITQVRQQVEEQKRSVKQPDGEVHILEPEHIVGLNAEDAPPSFVKYFAPWCSHCKALEPRWIDMAHALQGQVHVYSFDCDTSSASKSLCTKEKVGGYPTLMFYNKGNRVEYNGKRDVESMRSFAAKMVQSTTVQSIANEYELKRAVATDPVVVLFLHATSTPKEDVSIALSSARTLAGSAPFYTSTSPDLFSLFKLDSNKAIFLVFKDENLAPAASLDLPPSTGLTEMKRIEKVSHWLRSAKLPALVELNGATIGDVLASEGDVPLVVIGIFSKQFMKKTLEQRKDEFEAIAKGWFLRHNKKSEAEKGREVIWTWVDADRWASWLKSMYQINWGAQPGIVVSDPKEIHYWNRNLLAEPIAFSAEDIYATIEQGIYTSKLKPLSSRSFFDRIGHRLSKLGGPTTSSWWKAHPLVPLAFVMIAWFIVYLIVKWIVKPNTAVSKEKFRPLTTKSE